MLDGDAPVVDLLAAAQPPGRRGRVPRAAPRAMGEGVDPRKAGAFERAGAAARSIAPGATSDRMMLGYQCANSRMTIAVAADHRLRHDRRLPSVDPARRADLAKMVFRIDAPAGQADPARRSRWPTTPRAGVPVRELVDRCRPHPRPGRRATASTHYVDEQRDWFDGFWARSDVEVDAADARRAAAGDPVEPLPARPGQRPGPTGTGVPAKGVTGSGYERPLLLGHRDLRRCRSSPTPRRELARNALRFRYRMLPRRARAGPRAGPARRAVPVAHDQRRGGLGLLRGRHRAVPHRRRHRATRSCSTSTPPATSGFLVRDGVDILVETARLWADLGFWRSNGERVVPHPRRHRARTSTRPSSTTTCSPT